MQKIIDTLEQKVYDTLGIGQTLWIDYTLDGKAFKEKGFVTFKWEGDDLLIDNTKMYV